MVLDLLPGSRVLRRRSLAVSATGAAKRTLHLQQSSKTFAVHFCCLTELKGSGKEPFKAPAAFALSQLSCRVEACLLGIGIGIGFV